MPAYNPLELASGADDRRLRLSEQGFFVTEPRFDVSELAIVRDKYLAERDTLKTSTSDVSQQGIVDANARPFFPQGEADISWDEGIFKPARVARRL